MRMTGLGRAMLAVLLVLTLLAGCLGGAQAEDAPKMDTKDAPWESKLKAPQIVAEDVPQDAEDDDPADAEDVAQEAADGDAEQVAEAAPAAPIVPSDGALYTYDDMEQDLFELQARYPELLQVRSLGTSPDGREIYEAMLGDPEAEKHILIQASIHAREHMNTLLAMRQLEFTLEYYDTADFHGVPYSELFADYCFHVLPMTNPDGVTISQLGPDAIRSPELRETLETCRALDGGSGDSYWRRWKANARGVDLNRNFDSGWQEYVGTGHISSDCYKGESPASEPEVQAILRVAEEYPLICTISYHSTGGCVYWDYGCQGELFQSDRALAEAASSLTGYKMTSSVTSAQDAAGCSDYFVLERGIPSVTIENGHEACPLPASEFSGMWLANVDLWPTLAELFSDHLTAQVYDVEDAGYVIGKVYRAGVNEFLTLRDRPSTSGKALRKLGVDAEMELLELVNDEFCRVRVVETGEEGYVMTKYLY